MASSRKIGLGIAIAGAAVTVGCGSQSPGSGSNSLGSDDGGGYGDDATTGTSSGDDGGASGGGSSSSSSSSGAGRSSSSGSGSGAGTSGGGSSSSGAASGSSSGSGAGAIDSGPPCDAPVASGAVALTGHYLASSVIAMGGYAYAYSDGMGSTACVDATALCGTGTTGVANSAGTIWGAGIGFNVNQAVATGPASPPLNSYAATGVGIAYALDALPAQGMRIIVDSGGTDYCAPIAAASGTVVWGTFNTKCWDDSGTFLSGPPTATHIQFQVTADAASTPFDVCVTSVGFATTAAQPDAGGGGNGTSCSWTSGPASGGGGGELTCYWFSQGTSTGGGCPSYKTYCGYCGTQSGSASGTCPSSSIDSVTSGIGTQQYWAAFPSQEFAQGAYCGMCVNVSYGGRSIVATIVDECATCGDSNGHIDLGPAAAIALGVGQGGATGNPKSGVTWSAVACPVTGDIQAVFNNDTSSQVYFQNVAFPVSSATAGGATGTQQSGFWNFGTLVGGRSVTLTDTLGHTVTGTIPTASGGSIGAQFPVSSSGTCN